MSEIEGGGGGGELNLYTMSCTSCNYLIFESSIPVMNKDPPQPPARDHVLL